LSDEKLTRISQNIGGIGNASVLPAMGISGQMSQQGAGYLAFDTGPGNVFIDAAMRILSNGEKHYDHDGVMGAKGEPEIDHKFVLEYLQSEPYFQARPPKTTGRELFSDDVAKKLVISLQAANLSPAGIIATITRITAESIAQAYEKYVLRSLGGAGIDEVYICGGGAYNPNILQHLRNRFPDVKIARFNESPAHIDPSAKEAVLFALLGFLCVLGRRVPLPADAESLEPAVLGVITPGNNYVEVMRKALPEMDADSQVVLGRVIM
jgi:1,6-anhydro-N-acetylmuramate kinase